MKKSRCPPETNLCGQGKLHMDIAAPGFDYVAESTASVCGSGARATSFLSAAESQACSSSTWDSAAAPLTSCCAAIVDDGTSPARQRLRRGCELFAGWGWTSGTPTLEFAPVTCPAAFVDRVSAAFSATGVTTLPTGPIAPRWPPRPPRPPHAPPYTAPPPSPPPPQQPPPLADNMLTPSRTAVLAFGAVLLVVVCLVWGRHGLLPCRRRGRAQGTTVVTSDNQRVRGRFRTREFANGVEFS